MGELAGGLWQELLLYCAWATSMLHAVLDITGVVPILPTYMYSITGISSISSF